MISIDADPADYPKRFTKRQKRKIREKTIDSDCTWASWQAAKKPQKIRNVYNYRTRAFEPCCSGASGCSCHQGSPYNSSMSGAGKCR